MDKELLFTGADLEKIIEQNIKNEENLELFKINDMTPEERKAFDYGLYILSDILKQSVSDSDYIVLTENKECAFEEYDYEELVGMTENK